MRLDVTRRECGVYVVVPHLPEESTSEGALEATQQSLINRLFDEYGIDAHILWYYTPMALPWTRHLKPLAVVYDCMDELAGFKNAPRMLSLLEAELFERANLVFTGGESLYEVKRAQHPRVYPFPSSIDHAHFAQARGWRAEPDDQADIPQPRLGFFGVIDERLDIELLDGIAAARPDWQLLIIGPVVKIDPSDLPRRANIHYLGSKSYADLPAYIAGWKVATLLFARNESTRYISPTKTPEYLAAGKRVVSTSIRDVVRPYGELGLVQIADTVEEFVAAAAPWMSGNAEDAGWLARVDEFLSNKSWDQTWLEMSALIDGVISSGRYLPKVIGQPAALVRAAAGGTSFTTGD